MLFLVFDEISNELNECLPKYITANFRLIHSTEQLLMQKKAIAKRSKKKSKWVLEIFVLLI